MHDKSRCPAPSSYYSSSKCPPFNNRQQLLKCVSARYFAGPSTGQFAKSRQHLLQWRSVWQTRGVLPLHFLARLQNPGAWLVDNTGAGPFTKFRQHLLQCGSDRIPRDHLQASLQNPDAWLVNNNTGSWLGDSWINTAWFSAQVSVLIKSIKL